MSRRKKKSLRYVEPELNIMPFIDVFGLLTTYLLFSAVFVSIGILEVQVPFISNAAPPEEAAKRTLEIKVDLTKDKIELTTSYSQPPRNPETSEFAANEKGIAELHRKLIEIKIENKDVETVTLYTDDDVKYKDLTAVLDAIKLRWEEDGVEFADISDISTITLFPKVVLGSVIL